YFFVLVSSIFFLCIYHVCFFLSISLVNVNQFLENVFTSIISPGDSFNRTLDLVDAPALTLVGDFFVTSLAFFGLVLILVKCFLWIYSVCFLPFEVYVT